MLALVATTHATTASVMTTSLFCYSEELTIRNFLMVACSVAGRLLLRALFWSPTFVNSLVRATRCQWAGRNGVSDRVVEALDGLRHVTLRAREIQIRSFYGSARAVACEYV